MPSLASSGPAWLVKHRHTFYFRRVVPPALRSRLGKGELRLSLKTCYLRQARPKANKLAVLTDSVFADLSNNTGRALTMVDLTPQKIAELVDGWLRAELEDSHQKRLEHGDTKVWVDTSEGYIAEAVNEDLEAEFDQAAEALEHHRLGVMESRAANLLQAAGLEVDPQGSQFKALCHELLRAALDYCRIETSRRDGDFSDPYYDYSHERVSSPAAPAVPMVPASQVVIQAPVPQGPAPNLLLSEAMEKLKVDRLRTKVWRGEATAMDNMGIIRLFIDIVGDIPCNQLTADHVRQYQEDLYRIPANRFKLKRYQGKTAHQLLAMKIPEADLLHPGTVKSNFTKVSAFLAWLQDKRLTTERDLRDILRVKRGHSQESELRPYTMD